MRDGKKKSWYDKTTRDDLVKIISILGTYKGR